MTRGLLSWTNSWRNHCILWLLVQRSGYWTWQWYISLQS